MSTGAVLVPPRASAKAEPGCAGCWKDKSLCRGGMQRCTAGLEELFQSLAGEPCSGEDPRGSYMEATAQLLGEGSLNHVQGIVKGQETRVWESKWPGHPTPFLLPSLLKGGCGKMGCVHQQSSPVPTALVHFTAATLRMDMKTASPPVSLNITGCYAVALVGHLTPPSPASPA